MKILLLIFGGLLVSLFVIVLLTPKSQIQSIFQNYQPQISPENTEIPQTLEEKLRNGGTARVVVGLKLSQPYISEGKLSKEASEKQLNEIMSIRSKLLEELSQYQASVSSGSEEWVIPYVGLKIDEKAYGYLKASPLVSGVSEDIPVGPVSF